MPDFNFRTERTICFLLKGNQILLPMKKRGFGAGNYNGYGGKKEATDKTIEDAAVRELLEEAGLTARVEDLDHRGTIHFYFPARPELNQKVQVYFLRRWQGEPVETEEMKPKWFDMDMIPCDKMWDSDKYWLEKILDGKKITATFVWKEDNKTVDRYQIEES